jgi:hypothetical protein
MNAVPTIILTLSLRICLALRIPSKTTFAALTILDVSSKVNLQASESEIRGSAAIRGFIPDYSYASKKKDFEKTKG